MSSKIPSESEKSRTLERSSGDAAFDRADLEKRFEELKREKMFDPVQRWKAIQEMIAWAEQNMPPHLRRNRPRTHSANQPSTKK